MQIGGMEINMQVYNFAREKYAELGIDTEQAMSKLGGIKISMHCWQGDDVKGFLSDNALSGGLQAIGNYPGAAKTAGQLRTDIELAFSLIPGKHKVNLHAIYADTDEKIDLDQIETRHFERWVSWAKEQGIGMDFNPTCFSHKNADDGFTLSSAQDDIRNFWIEHCKRSRKIGEYFGKELGQKCVTNIWIADGYKDTPADRTAPRRRLLESLDEIFAEKLDETCSSDAVESKLFGLGSEAYVTGSHEFYMGYAATRKKLLTLDSGHFHPTEVISGKISALMLFFDEMLLHVSRPMRWDSDHVVTLDDELCEIAKELVRDDIYKRVHIGLDYFDASVNRVAAWVIGMRNMQKALLKALLEPTETIRAMELSGDYTGRLAFFEELRSMPWQAVWDEFCGRNNVPVGFAWLDTVRAYEKETLSR